MKFGLTFYFILVLSGCFKKAEVLPETKSVNSAALRENGPKAIEVKTIPNQLLNKEQREAIYFSASLEKEALRLMTKNQYADDMSLFSVLSFAVEIAAGVKKNAPTRLDCTRFRFTADPKDKKIIQVFKTCQKPEALVATIKEGADTNHLGVTFLIKEWGAVVGLSVAVTGSDVVCDLQIKNKKLSSLNCLNWTKNLISSATSSEELKLKTFIFNREDTNQFTVKGGIYKDLVERRKIEMRVPLEGKIKLFEKEIEVIDEFAEKPIEPKPESLQIGNAPKKSEIQKMGELIEKNGQKNQNGNEEGQGQNNQGQNGQEDGPQQIQIGQPQNQSGGQESQNGFENQNGQQGENQNGPTGQYPQNVESSGRQNRQPRLKPENGSEQPIPAPNQEINNGGIPTQGR